MVTLTTFNGSLWVLGSRWCWSRLVLVGTELLFLFGSLQFLLVVRLLLNVQLLLDLMRSTASVRRHEECCRVWGEQQDQLLQQVWQEHVICEDRVQC